MKMRRLFSAVLALAMVFSMFGVLTVTTVSAEGSAPADPSDAAAAALGYVCRIGDVETAYADGAYTGYYKFLTTSDKGYSASIGSAALPNAEGKTITLIANVTLSDYVGTITEIALDRSCTIDGQAKYSISRNQSLFTVTADNVIFKNVTLNHFGNGLSNGDQGIKIKPAGTADKYGVTTFDGVIFNDYGYTQEGIVTMCVAYNKLIIKDSEFNSLSTISGGCAYDAVIYFGVGTDDVQIVNSQFKINNQRDLFCYWSGWKVNLDIDNDSTVTYGDALTFKVKDAVNTTTATNTVAKIGATGYKTFDAAWKAAVEGDTITLCHNICTNATYSGKNVTIDGNGFAMVSMKWDGYAIAVAAGNTLTLKNLTLASAADKQLLQINNNGSSSAGTLTAENCKFVSTGIAADGYFIALGTLNMTDCAVMIENTVSATPIFYGGSTTFSKVNLTNTTVATKSAGTPLVNGSNFATAPSVSLDTSAAVATHNTVKVTKSDKTSAEYATWDAAWAVAKADSGCTIDLLDDVYSKNIIDSTLAYTLNGHGFAFHNLSNNEFYIARNQTNNVQIVWNDVNFKTIGQRFIQNNVGTTTANNCTFTGNGAFTSDTGLFIANGGAIVLNNCVVRPLHTGAIGLFYATKDQTMKLNNVLVDNSCVPNAKTYNTSGTQNPADNVIFTVPYTKTTEVTDAAGLIAAAKAGAAIVKLKNDISLSARLNIDGPIYIDGQGYKIEFTSELTTRPIHIVGDNVTIKNVQIVKAKDSDTGLIQFNSTGSHVLFDTVTMKDTGATAASSGLLITPFGNQKLTFQNCTITPSAGSKGFYALSAVGTVATFDNTTITVSGAYGAEFYNSTLNVTGASKISGATIGLVCGTDTTLNFGGTSTLSASSNAIHVGGSGKNVTVNVTGGTVTSTGAQGIHEELTADKGSNHVVNVTGGTITGKTQGIAAVCNVNVTGATVRSTTSYAIQVGGSDAITAALTLNDGAQVTSDKSIGVLLSKNSTVTMNAGATVTAAGNGIQTGGGASNVTITVNGGTITSTGAIGIFEDCSTGTNRTVNINGGTITGKKNGVNVITALNLTGTTYNISSSTAGVAGINVFSDTALTIDEEAIDIDIAMTDGASARIKENSSGLRFSSNVTAADVAELEALKTAGTITAYGYSTVIFKEVSFEGKYGPAEVMTSATAKGQKVVAKDGINVDTDGNVTFNAALINFNTKNYGTNFGAVASVEMTLAGGNVLAVSTLYNATNNLRNVKAVATAALADEGASYTAAQTTILENYVNGVANYVAE